MKTRLIWSFLSYFSNSISSVVFFSILSGDALGHFTINRTSGEIFVAGMLDREQWPTYSLRVEAIDGASFSTVVWAFISVIDTNDNAPLFASDPISVNVSEASKVGDVVFTVTATDKDIGTNAIIAYELLPHDNTSKVLSYFSINSSTAAVSLLATLDRESRHNFSAILVANDSSLASNTTLIIYITDFNDVVPVFEQSTYSAHVSENITQGISIVRVSATDADVDPSHQVLEYRILSGDIYSWFTINSSTGVISAHASLDREQAPTTYLTVGAVNTAPPHLTGKATVVISLEDINDSPPDFGPSRIVVSVKENQPVGTAIGFVSAVDRDVYNNTLWYHIVYDNTRFRLKINESNGLLVSNAVFDREVQDQYWVIVEATDRGLPPLSSRTNASVVILDVNDNSPIFDQSDYRVSISEASPNDTLILTVTATDRDIGTNADIRYSFGRTLNAASSPFRIDSITGQIHSVGVLDRETQQSYQIELIASDLGVPPRSSTVTLVISLSDVNDNAPAFLQTLYSSTVRENLAVGTSIIRVTATDTDAGEDGKITYSLVASVDSSRFHVTPDTGVIYSTVYLDREVQASYSLTLVANNSASSRPVAVSTVVNINVTDLNDNVPRLTALISQVRIPESTPIGAIAGMVPFIDGDEGRNGSVNITVLGGDSTGIFSIKSSTGEITLYSALDYETTRFYSLYISFSDFAQSPLSSVGTLNIIVEDSNDNAPTFLLPKYTQTVSHLALVSDDVIAVTAEDKDTSAGSLSYAITADNSGGLFQVSTLSSGSGVIRVAKSLAAQVGGVYRLVLQVNDTKFAATTEVIIHVQNTASGPNFFSMETNTIVDEQSSVSSTVGRVLTTGGTVGVVSSSASDFTITANGDIQVSQLLDYRQHQRYDIVVSLTQAGSATRYAQLRISVRNTKNHFAPSFPSNQFTFSVPEATSLNTAIGELNVVDQDDPSLAAGIVTYSVSQETSSGHFTVDSSGRVRLSRVLDYETGSRQFSFVVTASNSQSSQVLSNSATVSVVVTESNDITPRFNLPLYFVQLSEDRPVSGISVVSPTATDGDSGSNGALTFSLFDDPINGGNFDYVTFSVNTYTAAIAQSGPLDRERHEGYNLLLRASDGGNPPRTATVPVTIQIIDVNDNTPIWTQPSYQLTLYENQTLATRLITVNATDADKVDAVRDSTGAITGYNIRNGLVRYSIVAGDPLDQFTIDAATGVVTLKSHLDRERTQRYNITLRATDGGGRFADVSLFVTVLDNNDNPPVFQSTLYTASVPEDSKPGVDVVKINAKDPDLAGPQSQVYYGIVSGNTGSAFTINSTTGQISTGNFLDRETIRQYNLTVFASDRGRVSQTSTVSVIIDLIDINEFSPVFSSAKYTRSITEATSVGRSVEQVFTSDEDFGPNATVTYSIVSGAFGHFVINASSGVVSVSQKLDFETRPVYTMTVKAEDNAPAGTRLSNTTTVVINLLDANDNRPEFGQPNYTISVSEFTAPGTILLNITSSDRDSGTFADIHYQLSFSPTDDSGSKFAIGSQSGSVTLTAALDRETYRQYVISVTAIDGGGLLTTTTLTVIVTDENDNNPIFGMSSYDMVISEDVSRGTPVLRPTATDRDIGSNALLIYTIQELLNLTQCLAHCPHLAVECAASFSKTPSFARGFFTVNPSNGVVLTAARFDRELIPVHVVKLFATDSAVLRPRQGSACAVFNLSDINDNDPAFLKPSYMLSIAEGEPIGFVVGRVKADDPDINENARLVYSLANSSAGHLFEINPLNGTITSRVIFDREVADTFHIEAIVQDNGSPSRRGTANVTISITDKNDNGPIFIYPNTTLGYYQANVYENEPAGLFVTMVTATDRDIGTNGQITFSLISNPHNHFVISPSGQVNTSASLDLESIPSYDLVIQARDHGTPAKTSVAQLRINVLDRNDNFPVFSKPEYSVAVPENLSVSSNVTQVFASDLDMSSNALIRFALAPPQQHGNLFSIDASTGLITLAGALDYEQETQYFLNISATDSSAGEPQLTSYVEVNISVVDVNDNAPQFSSSHYQVPISEATPVNSTVFTVTATDDDITFPNNDIMYSLSDEVFFAINSSTGALTLLQHLDREVDAMHDLVLTATDGGNPALSSTARITFYVLDVNDNFPVFEQQDYAFSIDENRPAGSFVGAVFAKDIDKDNITYKIVNDTSGGNFHVNSTTGVITTTRLLDREANDTHFLSIFADDGHPVRSASSIADIVVTVKDRNDETPQFVDKESYHVAISELLPIGQDFFSVSAEDGDIGTNARLTYHLLPSNDSRKFIINPMDGNVSLSSPLDYESQQFFTLIVEVSDEGVPPLFATATLNVTVIDENDNTPIFEKARYNTTILESTSVGTNLLQVQAADTDSTTNAALRYSITSGNTGGDFAVNSTTGEVSVKHGLDYERTRSYHLTIEVSDLGNVPRSSTTMVDITIVDLNDNSPVFTNSTYTFDVAENTPTTAIIARLTATDRDDTSNSQIHYFLSGGNSQGRFALDEITGALRATIILDAERYRAPITLIATASDRGATRNTGTASVIINVIDVNDNRPQFSKREFSLTVQSSVQKNASLLLLPASDQDQGTNAALTFHITHDIDPQLVRVNQATGDLIALRNFSNVEGTFFISVQVRDGGRPSLSDTCIVKLVVQRANTSPPRFLLAHQSVTVSPQEVAGSTMAFAIADDVDFPPISPGLTYSLKSSSVAVTGGYFAINRRTGHITVTKSLVPLADTLTFVEVCSTDSRLTSCQFVNITITKPTTVAFPKPSYEFSVSEWAMPGWQVGAIFHQQASAYLINASSAPSIFSILSNGTIITTGHLDYDAQSQHVLTVSALSSSGQSISTVAVLVSLIDENDFSPSFSSQSLAITIPETSFPGTPLFTVAADDLDRSTKEKSSSYMIVSGNSLGWFTLDSMTGQLRTRQLVDRESLATVSLNISATNYLSSLPLKGYLSVDVIIADTNDNPPTFDKSVYQASIPENTAVGSDVLNLHASDPDVGFNALVYYSLVYSSSPGLFSVDQRTGQVSVSSPLNSSRVSSVTLTVVAGDFGTPVPQQRSAHVFISITAVNQQPPQFLRLPYDIVASETSPVGTLLTVIEAQDPDGDSSQIRYELFGSSLFELDDISGALTINGILNHSVTPSYSLTVVATDAGSPQLNSSAPVDITVSDENNHSPVFSSRSYDLSLSEFTPVGSVLMRLIVSDPDAKTITFSISKNVLSPTGGDLLAINSTTGDLILARSLDHESKKDYTIEVAAVDGGYPLRRSTRQQIKIRVIDENDNAPVFTSIPQRLNISRYLPRGYVVAQLAASDRDQYHGDVFFEISSGDDDGILAVNNLTGLVTIEQQPGISPNDTYNVTMAVSDGHFVTMRTVIVNVEYFGNFCTGKLAVLLVGSKISRPVTNFP